MSQENPTEGEVTEEFVQEGRDLWRAFLAIIDRARAPSEALVAFTSDILPRFARVPPSQQGALTEEITVALRNPSVTSSLHKPFRLHGLESEGRTLSSNLSETFFCLLARIGVSNLNTSRRPSNSDPQDDNQSNYIVGRASRRYFAQILGIMSVHFGSRFATRNMSLSDWRIGHAYLIELRSLSLSSGLVNAVKGTLKDFNTGEFDYLLAALQRGFQRLAAAVLNISLGIPPLSPPATDVEDRKNMSSLALHYSTLRRALEQIVQLQVDSDRRNDRCDSVLSRDEVAILQERRMLHPAEVLTADAGFTASLFTFELMSMFHDPIVRGRYGVMEIPVPPPRHAALSSLSKYDVAPRHSSDRHICNRVLDRAE